MAGSPGTRIPGAGQTAKPAPGCQRESVPEEREFSSEGGKGGPKAPCPPAVPQGTEPSAATGIPAGVRKLHSGWAGPGAVHRPAVSWQV